MVNHSNFSYALKSLPDSFQLASLDFAFVTLWLIGSQSLMTQQRLGECKDFDSNGKVYSFLLAFFQSFQRLARRYAFRASLNSPY